MLLHLEIAFARWPGGASRAAGGGAAGESGVVGCSCRCCWWSCWRAAGARFILWSWPLVTGGVVPARLVRAMLAAVPRPPIDSRCPGVAMQFLNWTPVACGTPLSAHWTCHHHGWCVLGLQGLLRRRCLCAIERQNGLGQNGYGHCQRCGCWFVVVAVGCSQCCCGLLLFAAGVAVCVTLLSHLI